MSDVFPSPNFPPIGESTELGELLLKLRWIGMHEEARFTPGVTMVGYYETD